MKSIFQKPVYRRDYTVLITSLGVTPIINDTYYKIYYPEKLYFCYPDYIAQPAVYIKDKFIEYINILETDKFTNTFSKNDKICIEDEVYTIDEVIYGIDKYIYRINEYEIINDEESKEKAMEEYRIKIDEINEHERNRKEKEIIRKEVNKIIDNLDNETNNKSNKKWW